MRKLDIINEVRNELWSDTEKELTGRWLKYKREEINTEIARRVREKRKRLAKQYASYKSKYDTDFVTVEGYQVPRRYYYNMRVNEYEFRDDITNEVRNEFQRNCLNTIKINWNKRFDSLNANELLEKFLTRHPWLNDVLNNVSYYFLFPHNNICYLFLSSILQLAMGYQINDMSNPTSSSFFTWDGLDESTLTPKINEFPIKNLKSLYVDRPDSGLSYNKSLNSFNYLFKRVDIYRYLVSFNTNAQTSHGQGVLPVAPLELEDLEVLDPISKAYLETIVMNIGTPDNPYWILLNKTGENWQAFLPPAELQPVDIDSKLNIISKYFPINSQQTVELESHLRDSFFDEMPVNMIWQYVLLARVLPFCESRCRKSSYKVKELNDFRLDVPLRVFAASIWSRLSNPTTNATYLPAREWSHFTESQPINKESILQLAIHSEIHRQFALNATQLSPQYLLDAVDNEAIEFSNLTDDPIPKQIATKMTHHYFVQSLFLALHHQVSELQLKFDGFYGPIPLSRESRLLLDINHQLTCVKPKNADDSAQMKDLTLIHASNCAGRNRFLSAKDHEPRGYVDLHSLWSTTGKLVLDYFEQNVLSLDHDFVDHYKRQENQWRKQWYDHNQTPTDPENLTWLFAQIGQMGVPGLNALFDQIEEKYLARWNSHYQTPKANLSLLLDLNGNHLDSAAQYMHCLADLLDGSLNNSATSVFKHLQFVLPDSFSSDELSAMQKIVNVLNDARHHHEDEIPKVSLHQFLPRSFSEQSQILNMLLRCANASDKPLLVMIEIPELDKLANTDDNFIQIKTLYRQLQNKILDNQRIQAQKVLKQNTKHFYSAAKGELDPLVDIRDRAYLEEQPFDGSDIIFPLSGNTPGIQQELQQAVEGEHKVEEQQEQQQEQANEFEIEIGQYIGDQSKLITRRNIEEKYRYFWDELPSELHEYAGEDKGDLTNLFSLWVGSDVDAPFLIQEIEPKAVEKILHNAGDFRMGLMKNHLPPGFYLAHSQKHKGCYVLCFDKRKEHDETLAQKTKPLAERNPFLLLLHEKRKAIPFAGDYQQLRTFSKDKETQRLLWKYLGHIEEDSTRKENAQKLLQSLHIDTDSLSINELDVMSAQYVLEKTVAQPEDLEGLRQSLTSWAKLELDSEDAHAFIEWFITDPSTGVDEQDIQVFAQLFYYYDAEDPGPRQSRGSSHFLKVAFHMFQTFGAENFAIWHKNSLSRSKNAAELLDKETLDAMALSMVTLKNKNPSYEKIWFKLIEAHAKSTGHFRYEQLWYAYQSVIAFIDKNNLELDPKIFANYFSNCENFNGVLWLDRLNQCLKLCEGKLFQQELQQKILNEVDRIDWRQSGLFYAFKHNNYSVWSEDLELTKFTQAEIEHGYVPKVDSLDVHLDPALAFGRYLACRLKVDITTYNQFLTHIKPVLLNKDISFDAIKLLLISIAHGSNYVNKLDRLEVDDALNQLSTPDLEDVLQWLSEPYPLDYPIEPNTFGIDFYNLPVACKAINAVGISNLPTKPNRESVTFSIGQAASFLNCKRPPIPKKEQVKMLTDMLLLAKKTPEGIKLLQQVPWIYFDKIENKIELDLPKFSSVFYEDIHTKHAQEEFLNQLSSIDFNETSWLPSTDNIFKELSNISKSPNPSGQRRESISKFGQKGCAIKRQDAAFRPITPIEQDTLLKSLQAQMLPHHKEANNKLLIRLLKHMAVNADIVDQQGVFDQLIKTLTKIDNKRHFNDLGIVLGLLVQHIESKQPIYISLPQLTVWLETMLDESHDESIHFPVDVLAQTMQLLEDKGELLNYDLNQLQSSPNRLLQGQIKSICEAEISNYSKPVLVSCIKHSSTLSLMSKAIQALSEFHKQQSSPALQKNYALLFKRITALSDSLEQKDSYLKILSPDRFQPKSYLSSYYPKWYEGAAQKSYAKLLNGLTKSRDLNFIKWLDAAKFNNRNFEYKQIIAIQTLNFSSKDAENLINCLNNLDKTQLQSLVEYCSNEPIPPASYLVEQLKQQKPVPEIIHHFETVYQAKNLRHYSVTPKERKQLQRVLAGIKQKGKGFISDDLQKKIIGSLYYINAYSQEKNLSKIHTDEIKGELQGLAFSIKNTDNQDIKIIYSMQILALMRETLLRQTGKWTNHTQMLDLIYAALHNEESLFHQVKTGQGKSIITIMRVAFHAINGKDVDVFTAKESLSSRDHEEFGHILDALGIQHAYVQPGDNQYQYKTGIPNGFGAVNYMTPGSFSLYQSVQCWSDKTTRPFNFMGKNRVAFIDEGDHTLLDEHTMFNFSDSGGVEQIYNYETWVYQTTWEYFQEIKDELPINKHNIPYVTRNKHLNELCERIQKQAKFAPSQSKFVEKYLIPALDPRNEKAIDARDKILKNLFVAAFTAANLRHDVDFCVQPQATALAGGVTLSGRTAKVVINNQIQSGSTYSEWVHQFLHVRLNDEAIEKGEQPNFFIDPDSFIALSQNVPYLLRSYYKQIEGCSGTMGDESDLAEYSTRYNINHVVKLPAHEVSKTDYRGMIFCEGSKEHAETIAKYLMAHQQHPTLLVGEHDVAVKELSSKVKAILAKSSETSHQLMAKRWITDTNDSGKTEKEILPETGKAGAITNSARMARGTDIKPETDDGLLVIRSNPDIPRFLKQSGGRQGRNGAKGVLVDIIDYTKVRKDYHYFEKSEGYKHRLQELMVKEALKLEQKLAKHLVLGSHKWDWIRDNSDLQDKYLKTRVIQFLKREVKLEQERNLRLKEALVAICSGQVLQILMFHIGENQLEMNRLRQDWLTCREQIESAWQKRMAGKEKDDMAVFADFYKQAEKAWKSFSSTNKWLDSNLLERELPKIPVEEDDTSDKGYLERMQKQLTNQLEMEQIILTEDDYQAHRKKLKKLFLKYHPDKSKEPEAEEMTRLCSSVLDLLNKVHPYIQQTEKSTTKSDSHAKDDSNMEEEADPPKSGDSALGKYDPIAAARHKYSPTQHNDMAEIISFYQHWLTQTEKVRELFETQETILPIFYDHLTINSFGGLENFYLSLIKAGQLPEKQEKKTKVVATKQLFTWLKELPQQSTFIPLDYFASIINLFSEARFDPLFPEQFACFRQLLEHPLANIEAEEITPHYMRLFGQTADLITTLVCHSYINAENPDEYNRFTSSQMVEYVGNVLKDTFWDNLSTEQLNIMKFFFTENTEVGKMLTTNLSQADWRHTIDMVKNFDETNKDDTKYLSELQEYLEHHKGMLIKDRYQMIMPILDMVLYYHHRRIQIESLPSPNCVDKFNVEQSVQLFEFLAKQYQLDMKEVSKLVNCLNQSYEIFNEEQVTQTIVPTVFDMPANIPLHLIVSKLEAQLEKQSLRGYAQTMTTLSSAGKAMNKFLHRRGITLLENPLPLAGENEKILVQCQALFEKLPLNEITAVFNMLAESKFDGIEPALLQQFIHLNIEEKSYLDYLNILSHLHKKTPSYVFQLITDFLATELEDDTYPLDKLKVLVSHLENDIKFINNKDMIVEILDYQLKEVENNKWPQFANNLKAVGLTMQDEGVSKAWSNWVKGKYVSKEQLNQSLTVLSLVKDMLFKDVKTKIINELVKKQNPQHWQLFIEHISKHASDLKEKELSVIVDAWSEEKIINLNHLNRVIESQRLLRQYEQEKANETALKNKKGTSQMYQLFSDFNNNGPSRFYLMHSLAHGLVHVGEIVIKKCYDFYASFLNQVVDIKSQMEKTPQDQRANALRGILSQITSMAMEVALIAKPLQEGAPALEAEALPNDIELKNYISGLTTYYEKQYEQAWFKNRARKEQARLFFSNLKNVSARSGYWGNKSSPLSLISKSLDHVSTVQRQILQDDTYNRKGYSRLLNISQQFGLELCRQLLKHKDIPIAQKKLAYKWLSGQRALFLRKFHDKIDYNAGLRGNISKYLREGDTVEFGSSITFKQMQKEILALEEKELPSKARYLLPILKGHFEIEPQQAMAVDKENIQPRQAM